MIKIKQNRYKKDVFANFALITQLGICMMTPIFLMLALGIYLEKKTGLFLMIPFLVLGILAGGRSTYLLAVRANGKSERQKKIEEENKLVDEAVEKWNKNQ